MEAGLVRKVVVSTGRHSKENGVAVSSGEQPGKWLSA